MMWFVQEIFTPMVLMLMLGACSVAVIVLGVYATAALREEERRVADLARAGERRFERYAGCGHDIGAMVALALACTHRDAVTRLTILDAPMSGWSQWEANFADPKVWHFAFHMNRDLSECLLFGRQYDYVSTFIFDRAFDHGARTNEDLEEFARSLAQPGNTGGGLEWYRAFPADHAAALAWEARALGHTRPRLGREHRYGPKIVAMLEEFATDVSGGSIANCAHWLPEERPAEPAAAILKFLAGMMTRHSTLRLAPSPRRPQSHETHLET